MLVYFNKISNGILWLCMLITVVVFAFFYFSGSVEVSGSEISEPKQTSLLLNWVSVITLLSVSVLIFFFLYRFYRKMREDSKSAWRVLILFFSLFLLWIVFYCMGDDTPMNIPGYEGKENVPVWLKLVDMWLYSIYFLVGITALSVFFGIFWSYLKKIR